METAATTATGSERRPFDPKIATVLLAVCMFMSGATGLVHEYVLATVSTYILGNSIEQFSIIIAVMMLMMGIANWAQKRIGDDHLIEKFVTVEIALALLGAFAPILTYAAFGVMESHFRLTQYFFIASIGFLIGFEIPLVLRINEKYSETLRANLASIFSMDYVGAFIGALIWAFILLRTFPLTEISFLIAGANFLIAGLAFAYFAWHGLIRKWPVWLGIIVLVSGALYYGYANNRAWNRSLEQRLYDAPIVSAKTTRYQRLVITHDKATNDYRLYINGNVQFSSLDEARYHELLVHPAMHLGERAPRDVLILGGGDGMALREVLKYEDIRDVTLVDLDPAMIDIARTDPVLKRLNGDAFRDARVHAGTSPAVEDDGWTGIWQETGRVEKDGRMETIETATVRVFTLDADRFVTSASGRSWDAVIVDFPDPNSVELAKLYSKEFYLRLRKLVRPGGMVAIQSTSPYHAREAFLCILRTVRSAGFSAIPYHENVPSFGDWGWILAWNDDRTANEIYAGANALERFRAPTSYLTPDAFRRTLVFGKGELKSAHADVNTLMHPVLLDRYVHSSWLVD